MKTYFLLSCFSFLWTCFNKIISNTTYIFTTVTTDENLIDLLSYYILMIQVLYTDDTSVIYWWYKYYIQRIQALYTEDTSTIYRWYKHYIQMIQALYTNDWGSVWWWYKDTNNVLINHKFFMVCLSNDAN